MAGSCCSSLASFVPGLFLLFATGVPLAGYSQNSEPLVAHIPQSKFVVTVTEGPGEPNSIGSYAVRLYKSHNPDWPFDNFIDGMVRHRDGGVEALQVDDIDEDEVADLIVVVRSAGSGRYVSADAFSFEDIGLTLIGQVEWLPKNADPVLALRRLVSAPVRGERRVPERNRAALGSCRSVHRRRKCGGPVPAVSPITQPCASNCHPGVPPSIETGHTALTETNNRYRQQPEHGHHRQENPRRNHVSRRATSRRPPTSSGRCSRWHKEKAKRMRAGCGDRPDVGEELRRRIP